MTHSYSRPVGLLSAGFSALLLAALVPLGARAQVGIGTTTPDASAALDVTDAARGLLLPRVALTAANAATPLTLPATSLLVYNTNAAMPGGVGFYHNAGTPAAPAWVKLITTASPAGGDNWTSGGNAGTTPATNFIGTTDAQDFVARTNNIERLRLKQNGALWQPLPNTGNTALGTNTANALAAGTNNTLLGVNAGQAVTGGDDNTYLGRAAGAAATTANRNTVVGSGAGDVVSTGSNNTLVGQDAGGRSRRTPTTRLWGAARA